MNLDELLKSIRDEGKKESSLKVIPVDDNEKLVEEKIDPKVLKLLGYDFVGDLTYGEYKTILKEKMMAQRMNKSEDDSGDAEVITNEYKRVKPKDNDKKFKVKKTKIKSKDINFSKGGGIKSPGGVKRTKVSSQKLLPGTAAKALPSAKEEDEEGRDEKQKRKKSKGSKGDPLLKNVIAIKKTTLQIVDILNKQGKFAKKQSRKAGVEQSKSKKREREAKLESGIGAGVGKVVSAVTKPFTNIFDKIKNFLIFTLLGMVVQKLFNILKNPKILLKPLEDAINGVIGFLNKIINFFDDKLIQPIRDLVNKIEEGINFFIGKLNEALAFIPGDFKIPELDIPDIPELPNLDEVDLTSPDQSKEESKDDSQAEQSEDQPEKNQPDVSPPAQSDSQQQPKPAQPSTQQPKPAQPKTETKPTETKADSGKTPDEKNKPDTGDKEVQKLSFGGPVSSFRRRSKSVQPLKVGGRVLSVDEKESGPTGIVQKDYKLDSDLIKEGGPVKKDTGMTISGLGKDTQLTALTPGEFVLVPGAAKALGPKTLEGINKTFGGDNLSRSASLKDVKVKKFEGGGMVQSGLRSRFDTSLIDNIKPRSYYDTSEIDNIKTTQDKKTPNQSTVNSKINSLEKQIKVLQETIKHLAGLVKVIKGAKSIFNKIFPGFQKKGTDTVPAMLTPGEIVMNKKAVDAIGSKKLLALNKQFGGFSANKPKIVSKLGPRELSEVGNLMGDMKGVKENAGRVMYAASGGQVPDDNATGRPKPEKNNPQQVSNPYNMVVTSTAMRNRSLSISGGMHMGVDIANGRAGDPLQAFTDGQITGNGKPSAGYGNWVSWTDTKGIEHFYAHMQRPTPFKVGDKVKKGTKLGTVGNTGKSTGPHLHWETATKPGDTGRSKAAALSRFNPLAKYSPYAPFGGSGKAPASDAEVPGDPSSPAQIAANQESDPSTPSSVEVDWSKSRSIIGDYRADGNNPFGETSGNASSKTKTIDAKSMSAPSSSKVTLDPTKTGASNPEVFAAAQKARSEARAAGLSPAEVEKRVVAASLAAKQKQLTSPSAPVKKAPLVLPLPMGDSKSQKQVSAVGTGGGTRPIHFPSTNPAMTAHRLAVKSTLGIA